MSVHGSPNRLGATSPRSRPQALDLIQYTLFPNRGPRAGMATPLIYRFRPNGDNLEKCITEVLMLFGTATIVGLGDSWRKVPAMGSAADVTDQDTETRKRIHGGIRASKSDEHRQSRHRRARVAHRRTVLRWVFW